MTAESEFFLGSAPSVARYDCLEISHPNFSQTYRLVRNNPSGITVSHDGVSITGWVFDGIDDRIDFADVLDFDINEPCSFSVWVRTPSVGSQQVIMGKLEGSPGFRGWELGLESSGRVYWQMLDDFATGGHALNAQTVDGYIPANTLTHVLVTYDGSADIAGIKFYILGDLATQIPPGVGEALTGTSLSTAAFKIGVRSTTNTIPFAGLLAHVAVFDVELTAAQALEVYNGGTPPDLNALPTAPAPVFWAKLDETDTSGAGGVSDHGTGGTDGTSNFDPTLNTVGEFDYSYCPARVLPIASEDDLIQSLAITLGDVGELIAAEIGNVWAANGMNIRPALTYRAFRSDDLSAPIEGSERVLEIASVTTSKEGATFDARAPEMNASRTGELYTVERFPMLAGFQ